MTRRDYTNAPKGEAAEDLQKAMTDLGLEFKIVTAFTSFVAVDDQIVTDGSAAKRIEVPVAESAREDFIENYWVRRDPENSGGGGGGGGTAMPVNNSSGITETVDVISGTNNMDSTGSQISTNVTAQTLQNLPINGRSLTSLYLTATGITPPTDKRSQIQQGLFSSNGQRPTSNVFTVDGLSANTAAFAEQTSLAGSLGALPHLTASGGTNGLSLLDATAEVTVKTIGSAKEQRTAGATVDFTSVGGNNTYHGAVFETFGNEHLNANDFFANSRGSARPASRLNQFGGTLGGFIVKNKAWFFGGYEGLRLRQSAFAISEVPDDASRQNASPEFRTILNAFPLFNGRTNSNGLAEFSASYTNPTVNNIFNVRVDFQPTDSIHIGSRYNFADSNEARRGNDFSLNTQQKLDVQTNSISTWASATVSPRILIEGRVNFTRNKTAQRFSIDDFGGAQISPILFSTPFDFLKYDFNGINAAMASGNKTETTVNQFQTNGSVVWVLNNHNLTFGADFRRLSADIGAASRERNVLFAGVEASGTASRISEISRIAPPAATIRNLSLFGQDEWRISPRLNVNLGLRWDADFAPGAENQTVAFQNASTVIGNQTHNFAPRTGIAWNVLENGKTVVRGGGGLYFDYGNTAASEIFVNSFPFAIGKFARNIGFNTAPTNSLKPLLVFDNNLQTPRTWQFFGEYQQEFFRNHIFTATYTAAFGRKLFLTRTLLDADPNYNFVRRTNNDAKSDFNSLQLRFERRFSQGFSFNARYTLSKSADNVSTNSLREHNFISRDLAAEHSASDFDVRHQFNVYAIYDLPTFFDAGWKKNLTRNWSLSAFANVRSAFPLSVGYFRANDFGKEFVRADAVGNAPVYVTENGIQRLNPNAFSIPNDDRQGNLERNSVRGFSLFQVDARLQRRIRLSGETSLNLSINAFNLLNNTNFADVGGSLGTQFSPTDFQPNNYFGQPTSTFGGGSFTPFYVYGGARTIQISAKFVF